MAKKKSRLLAQLIERKAAQSEKRPIDKKAIVQIKTYRDPASGEIKEVE